jgi:transcription initiation factor TFIID subunit 7
MDDDLIVVDYVEDQAGPSTAGPSSSNGDSPYVPADARPRTRPLRTAAEHAMATNFRRRSGSTPPLSADGRTTRSSTLRQRPQPKLKLKLSDKAAAQAPGMSFLGAYDRELDSDDDDLAFEEQFVLRMPPGEDCEKLKKMVNAREVGNDVWFKFKGEHRSEYEQKHVFSEGRFEESGISHWKLDIFFKTGGSTVHYRIK